MDDASTHLVRNKSQRMTQRSFLKTKTTWIMATLSLIVFVVGFLALKTRDEQNTSAAANRPLQSDTVVEPPVLEPPVPELPSKKSSKKGGASSRVERRRKIKVEYGKDVRIDKASMKKAQALLDKALRSLMNRPTRQEATKDRPKDAGNQAQAKKFDAKSRQSREYRIKGSKLFIEKKFDEAIAAYKKALELDPDDHELLRMMGAASVQSGNRQLAHLYYSMYIGRCPKCTSARSVKRLLKGLK